MCDLSQKLKLMEICISYYLFYILIIFSLRVGQIHPKCVNLITSRTLNEYTDYLSIYIHLKFNVGTRKNDKYEILVLYQSDII